MVTVRELKEDIENNEDIILILRKALNISHNLELTEYEKWILSELKGYEKSVPLPDYRIVDCEVLYKVTDRYMKGVTLNPLEVGLPKDFNEFLKKIYLRNPLNLIIDFIKRGDDTIQFKAEENINKTVNQYSKINVEIYRQFPIANLKNIIEQVKNNLYILCLKLEKYNLVETSNYTEKDKELVNEINFNTVILNINTFNLNITNKIDEIIDSINEEDINDEVKIEVINNINIVKNEIQKESPDTGALRKTCNILLNLGKEISSSIIAQAIISLALQIYQTYPLS